MIPRASHCLLLIALAATTALPVEDHDHWMKYGDSRLKETLKYQPILGHAKNVVIFVGDGMGMSTITAARIYKGQLAGQSGEEYQLTYEHFPNVGLSKTYNVDKQVPDSAGTATAMFTGVKSNYYMLGLDSKAKYNECNEESNERSKLDSIMKWAQEAGKHTGVVTTTRITHATPAALYAHSNHRDWECDSEIPFKYRDCIKDIARQLVEDEPGRNFKVILGGGLKQFGIPVDPGTDDSCNRTDDLNLLEPWLRGKNKSKFVNNTGDLMNADVQSLDYLLGLFSPGHMPYALERDQGPKGSPSLQNMTAKAVEMLSKSPTGFVLMVEGGRIDHGHHDNYAKMALHEAAELDDAIAYVAAHTDPRETLIIVTADHSHAFTINGYPKRGNDILGYANRSASEGLYETLTYANGPGFNSHRSEARDCSSGKMWRLASEEERRQPRYRHFAPYYLEDETHGGEDVPVYSRGPSAHLLSGTFEENYIAHVIGYAACIGPPSKLCNGNDRVGMLQDANSSSSSSSVIASIVLPILLLIALHFR